MMLGRDRLLARLDGLLDAGAPLVSLVGPGGIGKTRLSRALLERRGGRFVDLSEGTSSDDVMAAVATALGVPLPADEATAVRRLVVAAEDLDGLVVLDNAEPLLDVVRDRVERLLEAGAPRLVVTSRLPLGLPEEQVLRVGPLDPASARAVFVTRADPEVVRPDRDGAVIDALVEALGGNPLALELAAGRTPVQGLARIRAALDAGDPLADLDGGRPDRHGSLDALVRSSWELLDDEARRTLSALGLFRAGFRFDDVLDIGLPGAAIRRLQRASLLHREVADGDVWLGLLDEVRRWVRLHAPAEAPAVRRHLGWASERARELARRFHRVGAAPHRQSLGRLVPELVAGLEHAGPDLEPRVLGGILRGLLTWRAEYDIPGLAALVEPVLALREHLEPLDRAWALGRVAGALRRRGRAVEALDLLEEALEDPTTAPVAAARHQLRIRHANTCLYTGRADEARRELEALLPALEDQDRTVLLADALRVLGTARRMLGDREGAQEALHRCLTVARRADLATLPALALSQLVMGARDASEAAALVEEARQAIATVGSHEALEWVLLTCLVTQQIDTGAVEAALQTAEQLEVLARRRGDIESTVHLRARLAAATLTVRPLDEAEDELTARLAELTRLEVGRSEAWVLVGLGVVAHLRGQLDLARERYTRSVDAARDVGLSLPARHAHVLRAVLDAEAGREVTEVPAHPIAARLVAWIRGEAPASALRAAIGDADDRPVLERWLVAVTESVRARRPGWRITEDGETVLPPTGEPIDLSRRGSARRILACLLRARLDEPGTAVGPEALIAAGWPGERILPDAARARLYAVARDLRKRGLEALLQTVDGGYRLDPGQDVCRLQSDTPEP